MLDRWGAAPLLVAAVLAAPWAYSAQPSGQLQSKQKDLKKIQRELSQKKSERDMAARQAEELVRDVEKISQKLQSARRSVKETESRLSGTEKTRKNVEQRLWVSRTGIEQWQGLMAVDMKGYYERQAVPGLASPYEAAYRQAALESKISSLRLAMAEHARTEGLRQELVSVEGQLRALHQRKRNEQSTVERAKQERTALYQTVKGRRAILEKEIRDLNQSARRMESFIRELVRKSQSTQVASAPKGKTAAKKALSSAVQERRGHLPWPIDGKVLEKYGRYRHPELETYLFSNGIKVRPASGTAVRTVEKGEVLYAGEFMSYGLMALVGHNDEMHSIYAHMGKLNVARGQRLSAGDVVGTAGQDEAGRPLVYFELRVDGTAVDPLLWLK